MYEELITFATSIVSIAACAIGIQAIGKVPDYEDRTQADDRKAQNKNFLTIFLYISVLMLIISTYFVYKALKR